jgi:elongation factor Ts
MHVAAMKPAATNKEELDPAIVAQERATLVEAARAEGKPENIIENILKGQLAKFFAESCFLEQGFVKDPDITINQLLELKGKELGDTLTVTRFVRFGLGE